MLTATISITLNQKIAQLQQYQYESNKLARSQEDVQDNLDRLEASCKSSDTLKSNSQYKTLSALDTVLETKIKSLDTLIEKTEKDIQSFQSELGKNVNTNTTLWCLS